MSPVVSGQLQVGQKMAVIGRAELHRSIVSTLGRGLRDGVPGVLLDGVDAYDSVSGMIMVNARRATIEHLSEKASELDRKSTRSRHLAEDEQDDKVAAGYRDDARTYSREAEAIRDEVERRRAETDPTEVPLQFETAVDVLLSGLAVLLDPSGSVDNDVQAFLQRILHNFSFAVDGDEVVWRGQLLVSANGRVVALGPFTDSVARLGRGLSPAELDTIGIGTDAAIERRRHTVELTKIGYPQRVAASIVCAPGGYLARALLGQEVIWPDCPDDFDHDRFNAHIRQSWPKDVAWANKMYNLTNPKRQELTDLVAAIGGRIRMDQAEASCRKLKIVRTDLYPLSTANVSANPAIPDWQPSVRRTGSWDRSTSTSESYLDSIPCPKCGLPATAVVRVPEVPGSLLCRACLISPALPDLPFPPMYERLALPTVTFPDELLDDLRKLAAHTKTERRLANTPRFEVDTTAARAWARANGYNVGASGPLRTDIVLAFLEASADNGATS